tara:strand:- start:1113 stop:2525 length:1413 start_codon:yes stop_codon:yes gene_type:complete
MNAAKTEVESLKPAQLWAHMELLQKQLDLVKEALARLDPAGLQDEIELIAKQLETGRVALDATERAIESVPEMAQLAAQRAAAAEAAAAAAESKPAGAAAESVVDVEDGMKNVMRAFDAAPPAAETGVTGSGAADTVAFADDAAPAQVPESGPAADVPAPAADETAADVVSRMQAMLAAFEAAGVAAQTIESAAEVVARAHAKMGQASEAIARSEPAAPAAPEEAPPTEPTEPAEPLAPMAVVEQQLEALRSGAAHRCFDANSPLARRLCPNSELFSKMLDETEALQPLVRGSHYEVRSALAMTDRTWQCRVRVDGIDYRWQLSRQPEQILDIGTVVKHKEAGYVGVIVGWDDVCRRPEEWCQLVGVDELPHGRAQPFYLVMVTSGEQGDGKPADLEELQTTYVAHDLIEPRSPLAPVDHPGQKTLTLPGQLFTGAIDEAAGIWEPTPFLRAVYPRGVEGCWLVDSVTPD